MSREILKMLETLKRDELLVLARKLKVKGYTNLKKEEIQRLLIDKIPGKKLTAMLFPAPREKWKRIFNMSAATASIMGAIIGLYSIFFLPGTGDTVPGKTHPLVFTVRLRHTTHTAGRAPLQGEGRLRMLLESGTITRDIDQQGEALFTNIPAKYKNQSVRVELDAPGWQFLKHDQDDKQKNAVLCRLNGNGKTLTIQRDDSLSTLRFSVTDGNRQAVPGAAVLVENRLVGETDSYGTLTANLDKTRQKPEVSVAIHKTGFKIWEGKAYPGAGTVLKPVLEKKEK